MICDLRILNLLILYLLTFLKSTSLLPFYIETKQHCPNIGNQEKALKPKSSVYFLK